MNACIYLKGYRCQKAERDELDCLMCLHGQLVMYQQDMIDVAESMTAPVNAARRFMRAEDSLIKVNHAFEGLLIQLHPDIETRRDACSVSLDVNPLVR